MEVVVGLRDARELFEQPERTPLDDDFEPWCVVPGAEYMVQVIRSNPDARIVVECPGGESVGGALERYANARADELTREIRAEVRRAIWTLIPTGIVFVASLVLSRLAVAASSDWLSETFAEALIVIGWVVLWSPVAILGTDIWVLIGLRRAYRRLASSQIEVRSG